jgi:uroporphyrinogen-III decarboxylase
VKRDEAIALLKQIAVDERFGFNWISLVNGGAGCEIHIKPEAGSDPEALKPIFENRDVQMKEVKDVLVIYREH